jgi:hypothetical protein
MPCRPSLAQLLFVSGRAGKLAQPLIYVSEQASLRSASAAAAAAAGGACDSHDADHMSEGVAPPAAVVEPVEVLRLLQYGHITLRV